MLPITRQISNYNHYGRGSNNIKYIVLHYTANQNGTAKNHADYIGRSDVGASAHYFVDNNSIYQVIEDDCGAWQVGDGHGAYGITNTNSIGIEMCCMDNNCQISAQTEANALELTKYLMNKYNIDINHVVRHFDVTGKHCPAYFMDEQAWTSFKNRLVNSEEKTDEKDDEKPVKPTTPISFNPYMVRVKISNLNIRKGPGTNYDRVSTIKPGVYTIVDEQSGIGSNKGWGKLKSGVGWISLDYITKI